MRNLITTPLFLVSFFCLSILLSGCEKLEEGFFDLLCSKRFAPTEQTNPSRNNNLIQAEKFFDSEEGLHYFLDVIPDGLPEKELYYAAINVADFDVQEDVFHVVVDSFSSPLNSVQDNQKNEIGSNWEVGKLDQEGNRIWGDTNPFEPRDILAMNSPNVEGLLVCGQASFTRRGSITFFSSAGSDFSQISVDPNSWINALSINSSTDQEVWGYGGIRVDGEAFPMICRVKIEENGTLVLLEKEIFEDFPGRFFLNGLKLDVEHIAHVGVLQLNGLLTCELMAFDVDSQLAWDASIEIGNPEQVDLSWDGNKIYTLFNLISDDPYYSDKNNDDWLYYGPNGFVQAYYPDGGLVWETKLQGGLPEYYSRVVQDGAYLYVAGQHALFCTCFEVCYSNAIITKIEKRSGQSSFKTFSNSDGEIDFSGFNGLVVYGDELFATGFSNQSLRLYAAAADSQKSQGWFVKLKVDDI